MNIERTRLWGFILLFVGLAIGIPGILMLVAHERYDATVRIKVTLQNDVNDQSYNPYFIQTEFEIIKSDAVLTNVIAKLHLDEDWAKRYNYGRQLEPSEVTGLLKQSLRIEPVKNTLLVEITFTSEDPAEAANVANAIAEAYGDLRQEQYQKLQSAGVKALKDEQVEQQNKILAVQTNIDQLSQEIASPALTPEDKTKKNLELNEATNTLAQARNLNKTRDLKIASLTDDHIDATYRPTMVVKPAQTPTIPSNANSRLGKGLFLAGILVILAGVRLLWRAYFAAP